MRPLQGIGAAGVGILDWQYFRQVGTNPWECWYIASHGHEAPVVVSGMQVMDTLIAVPFFAPRGGTLDRIGVYVGTAMAGRNARLGIYQATSTTNLYPNALILDAGTVSTAAVGLQSIVINQVLTPSTLYYLAMNTNALNAWFSSITSYGYHIPALGFGVGALAMNMQVEFEAALAYGAFPNPYPAAAAIGIQHDTLALAVRYSA